MLGQQYYTNYDIQKGLSCSPRKSLFLLKKYKPNQILHLGEK